MAEKSMELKLLITGDGRDAIDAAKDVRQEVGKLGPAAKEAERAIGGMDTAMVALKGAAAGAIGALSVASIIDFAKQIGTAGDAVRGMTQQITMLSHGGADFDELYGYAQRLGIGINDASQQLNQFVPALGKLGMNFGEAADFAEKLNLSMRAYGVSGEAASSVTLQLGQALSGGVLNGDKLMAISQNAGGLGIELEKAVQQILGTQEGLKTLGEKGALSARVVADAWAIVFEKLRGDIAAIPQTLEQQQTRWENAVDRLFAALDARMKVSAFFQTMYANAVANVERWGDAVSGAPLSTAEQRVYNLKDQLDLLYAKQIDLYEQYRTVFDQVDTGHAYDPTKLKTLADAYVDLTKQIMALEAKQTAAVRPLSATNGAATTAAKAVEVLSGHITTLRGNASDTASRLEAISPSIAKWGEQFKVPTELLTSLIARESAFENGLTSPAGAKGAAQFMPGTAEGVAKELQALGYAQVSATKIQTDYDTAILAAAYHLSDLQQKYGGWTNALIAYNSSFRNTAKEFEQLPAETQRYIKEIIPGTAALIEQTKGHAEAVKFMADAERSVGPAMKDRMKAQDEASKLLDQTRSPLEKYNAEMAKLNKLRDDGAVSTDAYNRIAAMHLANRQQEEQQAYRNSAAYKQEVEDQKALEKAQRELDQLRLTLVPGANEESTTAQGLVLLDSLISKLQQAQVLMTNTQGIQQWQTLLAQLQGKAAPGAVAGGMLQQQGMTGTTDMTQDSLVLQWAERYRLIEELRQRDLLSDDMARQRRLEADGMMHQQLIASEISSAQQRLQFGAGTFQDGVLASLSQVTGGYTSFQAGATSLFGQFFSNVTTGFADSFGRAIVYSEDLNEAMGKIGKEALASLISGLVELGIKWAINEAIANTIMASTTAKSTAAAAATTAAWTPAAAVSSIGSWGGAAAAGGAAIMAVFSMLKSLAGFSEGGYTGNTPSGAVAGLVHGREYVVNARATAANRPLLERINQGRPVGITQAPAPVSVQIQNFGTSKTFELEQVSETDIRIIARDEALSAVSASLADPNSRTSKALSRHTTAGRRR